MSKAIEERSRTVGTRTSNPTDAESQLDSVPLSGAPYVFHQEMRMGLKRRGRRGSTNLCWSPSLRIICSRIIFEYEHPLHRMAQVFQSERVSAAE